MYVYIVDSLPSSASPAAYPRSTGDAALAAIGRPGPGRAAITDWAAISRHPIRTGRLTLGNAPKPRVGRVSTLRRSPGDRLARYSMWGCGPAGRRNGRGQRSDRSAVAPRVADQPVGDGHVGHDGGRTSPPRRMR